MKARSALQTALLAAAIAWTLPASAHCDTMDGPVVEAARQSLASGTVEPALIWVRAQDEPAIREAYAKARAARANGGSSTAVQAETAFYADLVRIHREGEGAPFTGLKPAGDIDPSLRAADRALANGRLDQVEAPLVARIKSGLGQRFAVANSRKGFAPANVEAGRAYVAAYVDYVHYVERVYDAGAPAEESHAAHGATHVPATTPAHAH